MPRQAVGRPDHAGERLLTPHVDPATLPDPADRVEYRPYGGHEKSSQHGVWLEMLDEDGRSRTMAYAYLTGVDYTPHHLLSLIGTNRVIT